MKKLWCVCINSSGTKWLQEGVKYLVEPRGIKVRVVRDEHNPNRRYGQFDRKRFKAVGSIATPSGS